MTDSWPDFDWSTMEDVNPKQESPHSPISPSTTGTMPTSESWPRYPALPKGSNRNVSSTHQISTRLLQPQLRQHSKVFTHNTDASGSFQAVQSSFLPNPSGSHHMPSQNFTVLGHTKVQNSNDSPISTISKPFLTLMPRQKNKSAAISPIFENVPDYTSKSEQSSTRGLAKTLSVCDTSLAAVCCKLATLNTNGQHKCS